uniref:Uncharacterized protein n=1 Tax=Arundo donax TaxID=35708 RepID=A0A0A9BUU9_ARUDO
MKSLNKSVSLWSTLLEFLS